jgi:hypothetical protein|tara:strand:- start:1197 stop:1508 length:312 start_codon:yes stop_codon:yes gene_type:complete
MAYTEKQWKADVEVAKAVLKETYVNNIVYVQERVKEGAKEEELKQIEDLIMANERLIVYFDEGDEWVKELHEQAKGDGADDAEFEEVKDDEDEVARIDNARNS